MGAVGSLPRAGPRTGILKTRSAHYGEDNNLRGLKVSILATDGFEQVELVQPRKALDDAGAETRLV